MILKKDKTKVLILTHYMFRSKEGEDTDQRIMTNLKMKVKKIVHVTSPFPYIPEKECYLTVYEDGKEIKSQVIKVPNVPHPIQYFLHVVYIYYFLLKEGFFYDLCIAMENLSYVAILPVRKIGLIKRLVYYSLDFVPNRFNNSFLNSTYHFMDRLALKTSDRNWVMVKEQQLERKKYGIKNSNSSPFSIVPIGYDTKEIEIKSVDKINMFNIVYAGALRESTGPELAVRALSLLIRDFPKIKLTMIGSGKDEDSLRKLIKDLKLTKYVDFLGYVKSFKELTEILSTKSIGLAPYKPIPGSFSFYSDPSKIKLYMVCGLPVITTDVTTMAGLIEKTKSGILIDYTPQSLVDAVSFLIGNKKRYAQYKQAAIMQAKSFDINHILDTAIKKIPD